ncbi:EGF-like domain protein [Dictyocaulus viviparus]|uniref:EGF-like domain protein n=1 Tax=Dictyocaulus viviparus TaxID=29172 RepID=A0A0D8XF83_DICVI|nr:EGF-like domain protein [Dictyocaulus viviparus]
MTTNLFSHRFLNCSCPFETENQILVANDSSVQLFGTPVTDQHFEAPDLPFLTMNPTNICADHVCLHNGTCVVTQEGLAACLCQHGFIGAVCEEDACSSVNCQNGGQCRRNRGEPYCECPHAFTGILCESAVALCEPSCINGECFFENGTTHCKCKEGFIGVACNIVDICLRDAPCAIFGENARCVLDKSTFTTTSLTFNNVTYECHCPHPISQEFTDCFALHLSSSISETFSGISSTWIPTAEIAKGMSSLTSIGDTTTSHPEITDSILVTTSSFRPSKVMSNILPSSSHTEPATSALTTEIPTTPYISSSTDTGATMC